MHDSYEKSHQNRTIKLTFSLTVTQDHWNICKFNLVGGFMNELLGKNFQVNFLEGRDHTSVLFISCISCIDIIVHADFTLNWLLQPLQSHPGCNLEIPNGPNWNLLSKCGSGQSLKAIWISTS